LLRVFVSFPNWHWLKLLTWFDMNVNQIVELVRKFFP
jgi:hypothetical protein